MIKNFWLKLFTEMITEHSAEFLMFKQVVRLLKSLMLYGLYKSLQFI
jgi:hypothetical protein